jgi:hypothetical protein
VRALHFLCFALSLTLTGCNFGPTKKQLLALESLRLGSTTRSETRKQFGKPWLTSDGKLGVDIYQLGKQQLVKEGFSPGHLANHGDAVDLTTLHLAFNSSNVLQKTNVHRWIGRTKVAFLVNRIGPEFSSLDPERIFPGLTKLDELEQWFGPPVLLGPNEHGGTSAAWYSTVHTYGGYLHFFEHQNLTVALSTNGTVDTFAFRGKFKPQKK